MLARAAERNPSIFRVEGPRCNLTEVIPRLLNIAQHVNNPWGNTKFLLMQFKPSPPPTSHMTKGEKKIAQEVVIKSKTIEAVAEGLGVELGRGEEVMSEIEKQIRERGQATSQPDIFEERKEAEQVGSVHDEPPEMDDAAAFDAVESLEGQVPGAEGQEGAQQATHAEGWGGGQCSEVPSHHA
jgi:tRNA-dihydrouridine synthase 2